MLKEIMEQPETIQKAYNYGARILDNKIKLGGLEQLSQISEYIEYHKNVWPEIKESLFDSGIEKAEIYHTDDRLFMILDVNDSFSLSKKNKMDNSNPIVNEWENLMWKYQKS